MTTEELEKLIEDGELVGKRSLAGADLAGGSFQAGVFENVDLSNVSLRGAKLGQSRCLSSHTLPKSSVRTARR